MNENIQPGAPSVPQSSSEKEWTPPTIDQYERIVDRAHKEIEGVRMVYKWLLAIVGIATTIIFVVGIYFSHRSMSDFKLEIRSEGEKLKTELTQESRSLGSRLQNELGDSLSQDVESIRSDLHKRVDELSRKVENRVEQEFQTERISTLISSNAISRVREVADPLVQKEIEAKLEPRIIAAENRIASLDEEIGKARGTRDDLRDRSEFTMTVIFAQNDDRKAFDQLKAWSEAPNFPFKNEAQQAWLKILDEHATLFTVSGFTVPWAEGVDPAELSFAELKRDFPSAPVYVRVALVEYIWKKREDVPKKDRMQFLVDTMQSDNSLRVVEYAGRFFTQESKQKIKPLAVDVLVDWWKKNKSDYEKAQPENPPDKE